MAEEKSLHRMPVADCGDYAEIPLSQGASGSLLGLRRNNRSRRSRDKKSPSLKDARGRLWGIRGGRAQRGRCPRIPLQNVSEANHFREA